MSNPFDDIPFDDAHGAAPAPKPAGGGSGIAARAMGATPLQIVRKVLLPEALPGLVNAATITLITLVGYSAMGGAVGAVQHLLSTGRRRIKGNMDIELTIDAMQLAHRLDHAVLFSGDGDFRPLVAALQCQGVRVSVVSTMRSQPPMIADELRRQADNFIELDALREIIGRPPRETRDPAEPAPAVEA